MPGRCRRFVLTFIVGLGALAGFRGFAQLSSPSPGSTANPLSIEIDAPQNGRIYRAPATVGFLAGVGMDGGARPGDTVTVDFYVNTNKEGSCKTVWHGEERPVSRPGIAVPDHIVEAGFYGASFDWKNAPAPALMCSLRKRTDSGSSQPFRRR